MTTPIPFRRPGTAIRANSTAPVVPSQDASRYQARDNPAVWYAPPEPAPWRWVWPVALFVCAIGLAVVDPLPTHWGVIEKLVIGAMAVGLAWFAWRRVR